MVPIKLIKYMILASLMVFLLTCKTLMTMEKSNISDEYSIESLNPPHAMREKSDDEISMLDEPPIPQLTVNEKITGRTHKKEIVRLLKPMDRKEYDLSLSYYYPRIMKENDIFLPEPFLRNIEKKRITEMSPIPDKKGKRKISTKKKSEVARIKLARKKESASSKEIHNIETVKTHVSESIEISYPGSGWIYLGAKKNGNPNDGNLGFYGKKYIGGKSVFTFTPRDTGNYTLDFLMQNSSTGDSKRERVILKVSKVPEVSEENNESSEQTGVKKKFSEYVSSVSGDLYYKRGDMDRALVEYIKIYSPENHLLNEKIARIYLEKKNYDSAAKYWKRNLEGDTPDDYEMRARMGLLAVGTFQDRPDDVVRNMTKLAKYKTKLSDADFKLAKKIGMQMDKDGYYDVLFSFLEWLKERDTDKNYADWFAYMFGRMYENSRELRNFKKAIHYYEEIIESYPWSSYYALAMDRIRYIKTHFLYVR